MATDSLTPEARHENATALATALGIQTDEAAQALDLSILVTADPVDQVAQTIARETITLLRRTVRYACSTEGSEPVAVEVVIGSQPSRTTGVKVYVQVDTNRACICTSVQQREACSDTPKILCLLVACYVSGATLYYALDKAFPLTPPDPFFLEFAQLGIDRETLTNSISLTHAYLAGAGAIGNGFLWAARYLNLYGRLDVVDDDRVSSGNLNRQVWFGMDDIDRYKAERLSEYAQPFFPHLTLVPRKSRLQSLEEKSDSPWLETLIVAVDSRRARRALQNEFPREVFDASTTDIREIVIHHHVQPTSGACLSCIYEPDAEEVSREHHIAEHLGVSVEAVRSERISSACAQIIVSRFPQLSAADLEGTAYDTLFKQLCGEGALKTLEGRRIVAPFAFVSVLAGVMLALELVRKRTSGTQVLDNYWRISPWHPPLTRRRMHRPKQSDCAFCANPLFSKINESLWTKK